MKCQYTVIQCVPDPIANERINVGVVVIADTGIVSRFISDWRRVKQFVQGDINYVKDFADHFEMLVRKQVLPSDEVQAPLSILRQWTFNQQTLETMVSEWENSIQFTALRPANTDPHILIDKLDAIFLKRPNKPLRQEHGKREAIKFVENSLRSALAPRLSERQIDKLVHTHLATTGKLAKHLKVDVAVKNGHLLAATQAVAFSQNDLNAIDEDVSKALLTLRDIRDLDSSIKVGFAVTPPRIGQANRMTIEARLVDARWSCQQLGAAVITHENVDEWSNEVVSRVHSSDAEDLISVS